MIYLKCPNITLGYNFLSTDEKVLNNATLELGLLFLKIGEKAALTLK